MDKGVSLATAHGWGWKELDTTDLTKHSLTYFHLDLIKIIYDMYFNPFIFKRTFKNMTNQNMQREKKIKGDK